MSSRWWWGPLWVALLGCDERQFLVLPEVPAGGSGILVFTIDQRIERVEAFAADEPPVLQADLAGELGAVYLASYPQTLRQLGLSAGRLEPAPRGERLPDPQLWLRAEVERARVGAWESTAPSTEIDAFRTPTSTPCRRYQSEVVEIPRPGVPARYLSAFAGGGLLIQLRDGETWTVFPGQPAQPTGELPLGRLSGDYTDSNGELWVTNEGGQLFHGDPIRGFTAGPSRSSTLAASMSGGGVGAELQLWTFDRGGRIERFQDGAWTVVVDLGRRYTATDIDWVAPDEVYFHATGSTFGHYHQGQLDTYDVGFRGYGIVEMFQTPGIGAGVQFLDEFHRLYIWRGQAYEELVGLPLPGGRLWVASVAPGEVLVGGPAGQYTEWIQDFGFCPPFEGSDVDQAGLYPTTDGRYYAVRRSAQGDQVPPAALFLTPAP